MKKICISLLSLAIIPVFIAAQTKIGLESLVPPAPNAAELGKYGTIPVGTLTGVPEIGFPLYEVSSGSLKVPISLSYHAAGIQVNQKSTDVGLGWSVMAGGTISRTVYSASDNSPYGNFYYTPPSYNTLLNTNNYYTMSQYNIVSSTGYDQEPDLFAYNMGGKSGKFIYNPGQGFMTIPFDPIKIQTVGSGAAVTFQIVDDNGVTYKFGQFSNTVSDFSIYRNTISSWYLTSMISADYTDTISFEYELIYQEDPMVQQVFPIGKKVSLSGSMAGEAFVYGDEYGLVQTIQSVNTYNELLVKKINFKNGYVQFNRLTTRKDNNPATKYLDEILVYNNQNQIIKKIGFGHDYFTVTPFINDWVHHRLKLTGFTLSDQGLNNKQVYSFDYDATSLPVYGSYNMDYWGYYNGANNQSLIPQTTVLANDINSITFANGETYSNGFLNLTQSWNLGNANREPSATHMKAAILNKVVYPSGGYSVFDYEPHKYTSTLIPGAPTTKTGGGLRIKSIKNYSDNNVLVKEDNYAYGVNEDGLGVKLFDEQIFYRNYEDVVSAYFWSGPGGGTSNAPCILYATLWQRQFLGISKYNSISYLGSPVLYSKVTKYEGNSSSNIGKTVYNYSISPDPLSLPAEFVNSGNYGSVNNAWKQGVLLNDTVYKKESSLYVPVSTTQNEYTDYNLASRSALLFKQHKQYVPLSSCTTDPTGPEPGNSKYGQGYFVMHPYTIKTGLNKKTKETKIAYDQGSIARLVTTVTTYQYQNAANRYMTETSVTTSLGNGSNTTKITRLKYPQDITGTVQTAMINKNILTPVLEEKLFKSVSGTETLLSTVKTNYMQSGNLIEKSNIQASTGSSSLETRINFNQYDINGNILEQQKTDDTRQSYVWDYGGAYPVAEVINSASADIAYTSFESDGKGNWTYSGVPARDFTTPSGKKAYNLSGGNLTKTTTSGTTYIISYWRPTSLSALTITGTQSGYPITGRTVNGWKYYEHKITGVTTATLTGSGLIDEVRLYPAVAQMTTYTYEPLVGITSQCDANNRISYYQYDGFGRLILIKDQDNNIVKKICYNYAGQPENCTLYGNIAKSGVFTKACSAGYTGSAVTYTVPANTYYATTSTAADQMALDDVAANGQAYANANGTCTQSCSFSAYAGYNIVTSGVTSSGGTVSFYIVFNSLSGTTYWPAINQVATINGACKPNSTKVFTMTESGRTWQVIITNTGAFSVQLLGGTPPTGTSSIALTGGSFTP